MMTKKDTTTSSLPLEKPLEARTEYETETMNKQLDDLTTLQKFARQIARKDFLFTYSSPQINEIIKSLAIFKLEMPNMRTDKSAGGRYNYQSLNSLLTITSPLLAKNNIVVCQPIQTVGSEIYVITMLLHTSGQFIRSITAIPKQYLLAGKLVSTGENLQALGGAMTYIKRYAYKSILGIDTDDDTDGGN